MSRPQFHRLVARTGPPIAFTIDGTPAQAQAGDTLMTAILLNAPALRRADFGNAMRAGFCLMAACQDCWVWTADGERLRACSTPLQEGMDISTQQPETTWSNHA